MLKYDKNKPVAFIHIPKTGGTSMQCILQEWFNEKLKMIYFDEKSNAFPKKVVLKNSDNQFIENLCINGHFNRSRNMGIEQLYPEVKQYFTVLREPFEIHISNYFFVKKSGESNKAFRAGKIHPIIEQNMTLRDYLDNYKHSYILKFLPKGLDKNNFIDVIHEHFIYIGIMEDMQNTIDILSEKLNKKLVNELPKLNISKRLKNSDFDIDKYKKEFMKMNELEYKVYNYVKHNYKSF